MFTQCPDCHKTYPVTKKQARAKKAQIFCTDCKKKFVVSALLDKKPTEPTTPIQLNKKPSELVTEAKAEYIPKPESTKKPRPKKKATPVPPLPINISTFLRKNSHAPATANPVVSDPVPERLPWEVEKKDPSNQWLTGFIIGLVLLIGQFIYFEHANWPQNPSYRPQLEKLCLWLGCQLADYQNLTELSVLQSSFTPNADNTIVFKAAVTNQAPFKQRLPNIKLTLLDYSEQLFAVRIFSPKDYMADMKRTTTSIAPDETVEVSLTIAAPKTPVGGYNFDLVY
jgi:Protein of unknown function (DUF3426)